MNIVKKIKIPTIFFRGHGYKCSSAPRPHPDFPEYYLFFVEDVGLCMISALSNHFYREDLLEFEKFKDQIASKYGQPTSEAGDTERAYKWSPKEGFNELGDVSAITLKVVRYDESYGLLAKVDFWLLPTNTCFKKIDEKANRAF